MSWNERPIPLLRGKLLGVFSCFISILILVLIVSCKNTGSVKELGIFSPSRIKDVAGQDGFSSIPISNSIMMWTFGDTIIGAWEKPPSVDMTFDESASFRGMIPNSLAFTHYPTDETIVNLNFDYVEENQKVVPFISYKKNEDPMKLRFWALDGIRIGNRVYVYYVRIIVKPADAQRPFNVAGIGLARWEMPAGWETGDPVKFIRDDCLFNGDVPTFGDAVMQRDSLLYLIGHKKTGKNSVSAFIARVKPETIMNPGTYEFLRQDGTWTFQLSQAGRYFDDVSGELSLSYNNSLNAYLIIYCSLSGDIRAVTFSDFKNLLDSRITVIHRPRKLKSVKNRPFLFYYSAKEIVATRDNVYAIYIHPAIYQPVLLKIPVNAIKNK